MELIKTAIGYARSSSTLNPESSIPNQVDMIRKYCENHGIHLLRIFADDNKTGMESTKRKQYQMVKSYVENKKIQMVVVAYADRLSRDAFEFVVMLRTMIDKGVELVSVSDGFKSTNLNPTNIAMLGIQYELENKTRYQRTFGQRIAATRKGIYYFKVPFGYVKNKDGYLELDPLAAPIVRKIFDQFLLGKKRHHIARELQLDGIQKGDRLINYYDIEYILKCKTYTGNIYTQKQTRSVYGSEGNDCQIVSEIMHAAIISMDEYELVERILTNNKKREREKHFHLLSGLLFCIHCGKKMIGDFRYDKYICLKSGSSCRLIKKAEIEKLVLQHFLNQCGEEKGDSGTDLYQEAFHQLHKKKEENELKFAKAWISAHTYEKNLRILNEEFKKLIHESDLLVYLDSDTGYSKLIKEQKLEELRERMLESRVRISLSVDNELIIHEAEKSSNEYE